MPKRPKSETVNLILRLPPELHQLLAELAAEDERSLNAEIVILLRDASARAVARKTVFNKFEKRWTKEEIRQLEEQMAMMKAAAVTVQRRRKKK
jgi:hypothetical protein